MTKANKSAEIVFNMTSQLMVGRSVTDVVGGAKGDAMLASLKELAAGGKSHSCLLKQSLQVHRAAQDPLQETQTAVKVNFYCSKLTDNQKRTYAYCLVFQPIV